MKVIKFTSHYESTLSFSDTDFREKYEARIENNNAYTQTIDGDKSLHEEFEQFCKDMGMSKTGATESAIRMYMDKMKKAVKTIKQGRYKKK